MFRDNIQKLVDRLEGGVGGVLMGFDGITVDSYGREGVVGVADIQTIGLEFAHLIAQSRQTAQSLDLGGLRELTFRTDKLTVLVQILNKDYFVACAYLSGGAGAQPGGSAGNGGAGNFGKARYLMRLTMPQIEAEL
jgi:predicted regulator of Ras-like GTPase activity (Roadblock/LC7/MglB family)